MRNVRQSSKLSVFLYCLLLIYIFQLQIYYFIGSSYISSSNNFIPFFIADTFDGKNDQTTSLADASYNILIERINNNEITKLPNIRRVEEMLAKGVEFVERKRWEEATVILFSDSLLKSHVADKARQYHDVCRTEYFNDGVNYFGQEKPDNARAVFESDIWNGTIYYGSAQSYLTLLEMITTNKSFTTSRQLIQPDLEDGRFDIELRIYATGNGDVGAEYSFYHTSKPHWITGSSQTSMVGGSNEHIIAMYDKDANLYTLYIYADIYYENAPDDPIFASSIEVSFTIPSMKDLKNVNMKADINVDNHLFPDESFNKTISFYYQ